jgi:hypothetical protein
MPFLGSVEGGEDLIGILVLSVEKQRSRIPQEWAVMY